MLDPIEKVFAKVKGHVRQTLGDVRQHFASTDIIFEGVASITASNTNTYLM